MENAKFYFGDCADNFVSGFAACKKFLAFDNRKRDLLSLWKHIDSCRVTGAVPVVKHKLVTVLSHSVGWVAVLIFTVLGGYKFD